MNLALDRNERIALILLCFLAAAVRLGLYSAFPGVVHPDETFQYVEQAHRLVYGIGLIPWEYELGIRSWLFAGILAGVVSLARLFGDAPPIALWLIAGLMTALSMPSIVSAYLWGRRAAGFLGAILAAGLLAVWFEPAYLQVHPLLDSFGAAILIPGLYLAESFGWTGNPRRLFVAGILISLAVLLRPQFAPIAAVTVLWICRLSPRTRWLPLLLGAALPLLLLGLLDWVTLDLPLQSVWFYFWLNLHAHIASAFGDESFSWYAGWERDTWSYAAPLILGAAALGAWRQPFLAANAAVLVLALSLVGHKEPRFILTSLILGLILAGIGSAVALTALRRRLAPRLSDAQLGLAGLCVWALLSATIGPLTYAATLGNGVAMESAMRRISADPNACGLAITPILQYWRLGGYSHLRPGVLLYGLADDASPPSPAGYDYLLALSPREAPPPDYTAAGFAQAFCFTENDRGPHYPASLLRACVWHRPGPCVPGQPTLSIPKPDFLR